VQKRLRKEREKATIKKDKARDSAASRWKSKEKGDANALRTQCYPEPKPKHSFSKSAGAQKKSARQKILEVFGDA
jgi:uncharacterized protein YdaU (DUF1376 family)